MRCVSYNTHLQQSGYNHTFHRPDILPDNSSAPVSSRRAGDTEHRNKDPWSLGMRVVSVGCFTKALLCDVHAERGLCE